ncbi:unnamed protein product [Paramecium octaurelia]|uniref:Uncharacterized protein n=1 Tax=Paramecium octaurelia TaxID=43137 RepID=A0A8S1SHY7_PAROT|nr:unnamed protein product [Paramecium octaurelia]
MPGIQLIQSQNLMNNIRKTYPIGKEKNTKISISTHNLFNKVQQKMIINKINNNARLKFFQEIENTTKNEILLKHILNCCQFRIKTETYKKNFAKINQRIPVIHIIPILTHLDYNNKNNLSNNESKIPRLSLTRSEIYNLNNLQLRDFCVHILSNQILILN